MQRGAKLRKNAKISEKGYLWKLGDIRECNDSLTRKEESGYDQEYGSSYGD